MNRFRTILAATLTAFALGVGGFVAMPTTGKAGIAPMLTPTERVDGGFAVLARLDPKLLAFSAGAEATRTVLIGYQTDLTGDMLVRRPGL